MDYVNRDVYGDFSLSGAIFLDSRCAADLTDPYTVIYGHHMDNSAMFGDVARFAEADYFAAHPAGSISLPDAAYTIELFACVVTDATTPPFTRRSVTTTMWGRCWTMRRRRPCSSGTSV